nr:hypothetical protein [Bacillus bingmayongensis]
MKPTNTKFAHEIINSLINRYVENELTPEQQKKFKLLTEIQKYRNIPIILTVLYPVTLLLKKLMKSNMQKTILSNTQLLLFIKTHLSF